MSDSVSRFMADARAILANGVNEASLADVGSRMAQAAADPGLVADADMNSLHGGDSSFTILQTDANGLTLMLAQFSPREETPIHDHGSWGVACVVRGRDRYRHWKRLDDGSRPDVAELRIAYERELGPGDFVTWLAPPADIHSQLGLGEPALELVLFGRNVVEIPRHYFDHETGSVRMAMPR